ncbi:unnamed protein product [Sphagnum jensenii]|uniref:Uncharacterized protein n=1 Tax=Sphagnum jensenii TaxID=128206 RepID=A0ABP0VH90_9BRYO
MGSLCEICVKQITLTDGVAANNTAVIGIAEPNVKIQTFSVLSLKLAAGSDYVSVADHPTTYVLGANNVLTITVPANGRAIPAAAVLQAHLELYEAIANLSEFFLKKGQETFEQAHQTVTLTPSLKSGLLIVDSEGNPLTQVAYQDVMKNPSWKEEKALYYLTGDETIHLTYVFPDVDERIRLSYSYVPEPTLLSADTDLNPVYPLRLQYLLVDGAFYHLCFAEEGTRPIRQQDKSALTWREKLLDEQASLMNAESFSTYGIY